MSNFVPSYVLYNATDTGIIYTFPYVQVDNSPQDPFNYLEISGMRGIGSVIVPGSTQAWDLTLQFVLLAGNYEAMISLMDLLETTIVKNTPYILHIGRTPSTSKSYKVKRLTPFVFSEGNRIRLQKVTCTLKVNSWV
jgi:hypothetical protein